MFSIDPTRQIDDRSHLKNRILVQVPPIIPSGIKRRDRVSTRRHAKYFEELKLVPNTEIGTKDLFEMASI